MQLYATLLTIIPFVVVGFQAQGKRSSGEATTATSEGERPRVLIVDISGPNRTLGEGVRTMGMVVDLQNGCEFDTDVLSTCEGCGVKDYMWDDSVEHKYLQNVRVFSTSDFKERGPGLASYHKIIVGGKLNILRDEAAGHLVGTALAILLSGEESYREKTWGFWDDVPFVRCEYKDLCPHVPELVARFANAAHEFYVLTPGDGEAMTEHMKEHHIDPVPMRIWPMRIRNLIELLPPTIQFDAVSVARSAESLKSKKYLTMMGNYHPVNKLNLQQFFSTGAISKICDGIKSSGSSLKLLFLGSLAQYADTLHREFLAKGSNMDCVEIREGYVSNEELERSIMPQTRAVVNPFFFDVKSGISVKSFEAVKDGMPFVTSSFGLHGLNEIPECAFPTPVPDKLADFVLENFISDTAYRSFLGEMNFNSCVQGQDAHYPVSEIC